MKVTFGAEVTIAATPSRAHQEAYRPGEEMPPVFNKGWLLLPLRRQAPPGRLRFPMP